MKRLHGHRVTGWLAAAWVSGQIGAVLWGRRAFEAFFQPHPQALEGSALALSRAYGGFLLVSGALLALAAGVALVLLSRGRPARMLPLAWAPPLMTALTYSLLPTHYTPGDSFSPCFSGVLVPLPIYLLTLWMGGWMAWGASRHDDRAGAGSPVAVVLGAGAGFAVIYLVVMWLMSIR